jgi:uncharacterized membrane protein YcgQ (UPF0703/DUF1980 family)
MFFSETLFFICESDFYRTNELIQKNIRKYLGNTIEPKGKANKKQSLKNKFSK